MLKLRTIAAAFALAGLSAGTVTTATAGAAAAATAPVVPILTQVSATHHYGYDQLVFQFRGGVPATHSARYVSQVIQDASGLPVKVAGSALLQVRFTPAAGHDEKGIVTYGAAQRTYALPELIQVVNAGDFESVLSFGAGLAQKATFRMYAQPRLGRVVLDVKAELARGLKFVSSGATGFKILSIRGGVARVQLPGKVSSGGSTFTIASEIMPTLKQFRSIRWVKIYDARGHTERPSGHSDSIPYSLEP